MAISAFEVKALTELPYDKPREPLQDAWTIAASIEPHHAQLLIPGTCVPFPTKPVASICFFIERTELRSTCLMPLLMKPFRRNSHATLCDTGQARKSKRGTCRNCFRLRLGKYEARLLHRSNSSDRRYLPQRIASEQLPAIAR